MVTKLETIEQLRDQLSEEFSARKNLKEFKFFPVSNELSYVALVDILQNIVAPKDDTIRVCLLFGESNFLSLLPEVAQLSDMILLADIENKQHIHTDFLLRNFTNSSTPDEFIRNYKEARELLPEFYLEEERIGICQYVEEFFGEDSTPRISLGPYHFLSSEERYLKCKEALNQVSINNINLDLSSETDCSKLKIILNSFNAEFSLCNFTNIHHYVNNNVLVKTSNILINNNNKCIILYAVGSPDSLSIKFTFGLEEYYSYIKAFMPINYKISEEKISFFNRGKKRCDVACAYVGNFRDDLQKHIIEDMITGKISNWRHLLSVHEYYSEAKKYLLNQFRQGMLSRHGFIITVYLDSKITEQLLENANNADSPSGGYFAKNIKAITTVSGNSLFDTHKENSYRDYIQETLS